MQLKFDHLNNRNTNNWPIARNTSSRQPDISLFMLSSMSRPEIFWYSWNTGKRKMVENVLDVILRESACNMQIFKRYSCHMILHV